MAEEGFENVRAYCVSCKKRLWIIMKDVELYQIAQYQADPV